MFSHVRIAVLFVCLCGLYLRGLPQVGLLSADEPRYASIGWEMAQTGDWITPKLWGTPWFEKPALLYWMVATAYKSGFNDDWAPRIGVALMSLSFLCFFYLALRREFGEAAAAYSTLILATSAGWFAFSQVGVTDIPMSTAFAAAMLLVLRYLSTSSRLTLFIAGLLFGVAVLAKGLVPLVLAAPIAYVGRHRWRDAGILALGCIITGVPWYWLCYSANGWPFIDTFFVRHQFGRFASDQLQHVQPIWFYLPVLLLGLFPWFPLLVFAFRKIDFTDPRRQFFSLWFLFGFIFFSVSINKLPGYLLPLFPAIATLLGLQLAQRKSTFPALATCAAMLTLLPVAATILPTALASGLSRSTVVWSPSQIPLFALPVLISGVIGWSEHRDRRMAFTLATLASALGLIYLQASIYPELDAQVSVRPRVRQNELNCLSNNLRRQEIYGANFYAHKELPPCR